MAWLFDIIDAEPSSYEEAIENKVWKDTMLEEYLSLMKNDVWDVVLRPEGKSVVTSKWIYKIKHVEMEVSKSTRQGLWLVGSPKKKE